MSRITDFIEKQRQEKARAHAPVSSEPVQVGSASTYAQAALIDELTKVLEAPEGTRNDTLNRAAFSLGQLVVAGALGRDHVERALTEAAGDVGLTPSETAATIRSGLNAGMQHPRQIETRPADNGAGTAIEPSDGFDGSDAFDGLIRPLPDVLDELSDWLSRFICVTEDADIDLLALWIAHTHVAEEVRTTPRLILDSTMPGSGKTTTLEHIQRFAHRPVLAASLSSPALLSRILKDGPRTILIDEADRSLDAKNPATAELLAIVNSGYKRGSTRPVLVPVKGGGWDVEEMSTHGPVAMAGNSPDLPGDTRSRSIRLLLMPDVDGTAEDSDWEDLEDDAARLARELAAAIKTTRPLIAASRPDLPDGCRGRMREKWRPLARVADAADGRWPAVIDALARRDMAEADAEIADGITKRPPGVILLTDLHTVWAEDETFLPTPELITRLASHRPDYWGPLSPYGKTITAQRFGRLVSQATKAHSRKDAQDRRGYFRTDFDLAWRRIGETPSNQTVEAVRTVETVGRDHL